ncbi:zinc ABC transporter substrate-binding protein [Desemzia sp. RIT804]|uniref:metal ABC transporter substrate-binding protein n=1 Tax=Desemzia sp. RIT 804 TaxID=2810209 RepID=UPI00195078AC|nr:metal ABC transporter substrate-binding protein [Desemzia sp. RIT 804]MBM6615410.1 zinc ABC transporter substrate-binding protein [Desemzia sp. RIT 804]
MKKLHKWLSLSAVSSLVFFLAACTSPAPEETDSATEDKLQVVTTFYPMYDFTKQIVQDSADVSILVPSGTDTHGFEPSAKDVAQIQEADVFIYNSEEMETWVPSILESIDTTDVVIVNASEGIELLEGSHSDEEGHDHDEEGHSHEVDPHIWLDPVLAQEEVSTIKEGLAEADPENEAVYTENAEAFQAELQQLNEEYAAAFENAENRTFVTQHAAFAYLAERYDLHQVAISGLSTDAEPSPSELTEMATFIKDQDVNYIYFGKTTSSAISETLANETNTQLAVLDPIEGITQADQEAGVDYLQAMRNNLEALKLSIY